MTVNKDTLFTKAFELQRQGNLAQAIVLYKKLLKQAPDSAKAMHFLGLAYAQQGKMTMAIRYLQQAVLLTPKDASLFNNLANAYKKSNKIAKAIHCYQQAIHLVPNYAQAHHNLAAVFALQNDYSQALNHYRLAIHAQPDFTMAHFNLGLLLLQNNELPAAEKQFNNVLTLQPDSLEAQFYLGLLALEKNQLAKAEQAFQKIIQQKSDHVEALTNLGVIALKQKEGQRAVDFFTKALAIDNEHLEARNNLAATFMHYDRFENALMHYDVLLKRDPSNIEYLYNCGVAQMALGHLNEAIGHFEAILNQQSDHFAALSNLAAIYNRLDDKKQALTLLERAIAANPLDKASQHMLNALRGEQVEGKACPEYVVNLFDNYALYYEQHMQGALHYTLPQAIAKLLHQLEISKVAKVLDLGCGTGLTGTVLREISQQLIGIDISGKMLAHAKEKGIYDELVEGELLDFLRKDKNHYGLVVAADVMVYLGELDSFFAFLTKRLARKGYFIFNIEISNKPSWKLQNNARFSHNPEYLKKLFVRHGLKIIKQDKVIARKQEQQELPVMLYVLQAQEGRVKN